MDVVIFGPPGAGKGTQASAICEALSVPHVATGDIFRRHLKSRTELGERVRQFIDAGQLVPDSLVVDLVTDRLAEPDAAGGALFDGFPRTVPQAELLEGWLAEHGRGGQVLVLNLEVADDVVIGRLSGRRTCIGCGATYHLLYNPPRQDGVCDVCGGEVVQREDDAESTVRERLLTYHSQTAPVLEWLRAHSRVVDVQADAPIAEIRDAIAALLK